MNAQENFLSLIEYWQGSIEDYQKIINECTARINDPAKCSKNKEASKLLIEVCKDSISKCQKEIEKLLSL